MSAQPAPKGAPIVKHHQGVSDYSSHPPAPFMSRVAATVVDGIFSGVLSQSMVLALTIFLDDSPTNKQIAGLVGSLAAVIYGIYPLMKFGFSPGKRLLGLRVVRKNGDPRVGFGTAFLREVIGKFLSLATLMFGFLLPLFNKDGKALHDFVAGTRVIKDDEH